MLAVHSATGQSGKRPVLHRSGDEAIDQTTSSSLRRIFGFLLGTADTTASRK